MTQRRHSSIARNGGLLWAAALWLFVAVLALALLCSTGCDSRLREDNNPAPSASTTKPEAIAAAQLWAMLDSAKRTYSEVANTGSMVPVLDSRSVLLLEKVTPGQLRPNDIALYEADPDKPTICHRVKEVRPDGIFFDGDNNRKSDGWVKPDRVKYRVAGILYTQR